MKKSRVLAVVMAVLMMVTLLPSMVFATAVPSGTLDGKLKVKGTLAIGSTLSADYSKVKPEGITDDNVSFSWSLKDGDLLTEVGTDKTYKIDEKDLGLPIVLKITGKEETGVSGELTVTTQEVSETEEEAKALAEKKKEEAKAAGEDPDAEESEASESSENTPDTEAGTSEEPDSAQPEETIEPAEETESADVQENTDVQEPADTQEPAENSVIEVNGEQSGPQNTDEADTSGDSQTETPDSADTAADASEKNEEPTYSASAYTEDGSGILDFGSVEEGYTEIPEAQMVTITNNGTGDLNFKEIAPENFMAADINDAPLKSGESVAVWVKPREGLKAGEYKDLITYQTEEGADVFFEADFTVKEPENKKAEDNKNNEQTDPGETSDPAAEKIYKLTADPTELPFDDLTAGYEKVETTSTVTIKNEGTEAVTLVQPESEFFDIAPVSEVESSGNIQLAQGGEQTFTVQPKLGLSAKDDPYVEELVFASDESTEASAIVTASVMVKTETPKTVTATVKPEGPLKFGTLEQGYETAPDAQPVTVENTGTEAIRIQLSAPEDYEVGEPSAEVLNPGDKAATFTVQPKTGLQAGDHSDTISVTDQNTGNTLAEVRLEFTVSESEPEPNPGLSVTDSLEFGTKEEGYKELPDAKTVTVTNTGNTKIVLKQPSSNAYTIGTLSATELEAGDNATFSVQPVSGLSQGEYLEDIVIANDANVEAYVNVHFSVTKKKTDNSKKANNLTGIKKPSDIKDLPNGTQKTQKALKLPGTVKITTTKGEQKASVKWDVKGSSYDPSSAERQIFNVKGTVILPEGVKNPNKISTVIAVSITVNGYQGTEAAASDNKITGIDSNGKYDTNTKITFTAAGAGMDNTNPRKGDTRYQPKSWKITETRTWDGEPYTATFRVSKPGKYTLKVTFGQQKYDGSSWKDTGTQSESTVTFTVSQAAVLTATPSPAVTQTNQKSAVQTGDSTPIMTFVIILIVAVVCIGGILVYRRKKK
ncbi:LPXTG cell wall anchor domain-containing protein [Blautia sp. MSK20_18]|uniref:LPXTG cell wall anchor domain-containing protein n=1 Tax=Blautia sp. MSK20_18 TaxID=2883186 RepID=UPI0022374444|nr:LPXTG cell wall anchor domain-containing protein [Blautia sp. MSK20_18]MCB7508441.1 LPXTG cell wall anchor domain-containing protein [Blautia sp. MSK20_18]